MTASIALMEKGKPPALGRCLIATDGSPLPQPRGISNLVPHAGVISAPKASSGPAGSSYIFARQGLPHTPAAASLEAALLHAGAPGGRVEWVCSDVTASFLHLDRRPTKNAAQHFAQSLCSVAPSVVGSAHGSNHGASNAREVGNPCRDLGNVCRA